MTRESFPDIATKISEIVKENEEIQDVMLMIRLGFNPESWRRWKTKLLELFSFHEFYDEEKDSKFRVHYVKKEKVWRTKEV